MRNWLIVLTLFLFSMTVFADTYYYYKDTSWGAFCSTDKDKVCTNYTEHYTTAYASTRSNVRQTACTLSSSTNNLSTSGLYDSGRFALDQPWSGSSGARYQFTCQPTEDFQLNGCTPTCVPKPSCKGLQGQSFTAQSTCGTASCMSPGVFVQSSSGAISCSTGRAMFLPTLPISSSKNGCTGVPQPDYVATNPRVQNSAIGQSSTTAYCDVAFFYTGSEGPAAVEQAGLVSLDYSGVTPTTEDGTCPPNTVKGQGPMGWICIPDTPTDNQCPTGQIRDNTGTCVPTTDAGQCPTGQTRNADGICAAPPTDNGNTGGTSGNTGGSSGGGGGGGGSAGSGGSSGSGDSSEGHGSSTGEAGSGSSSGAGGKTGAYKPAGCETAPTCSGDPLQCAALEADWKRNCENMGISEGSATAANALATASNEELKTAVTAQEAKASGFLADFNAAVASVTAASGQCPNDAHISVMSRSITIPFSQGCVFFHFLHLLVIIGSYFAAARIIFDANR